MLREGMRGTDQQQNHMFSYLSPETRVRQDHPLRTIRTMVDVVLAQLSPRFDSMYARVGRPSIAPEKLLRVQLLQMLYSIRSERLLMEEMDYNLLFRWFVGLNADDEVWDATTFSKNRDRLLEADVAQEFLSRVVEQARAKGLTSDEHFTVDGTLLEAWASLKCFQSKQGKSSPPPDDPGNPTVNFRGEKRSNDTHVSKTDPDALLARKSGGKEWKLSYSGNLLAENRNGLIVDAEVFQAKVRSAISTSTTIWMSSRFASIIGDPRVGELLFRLAQQTVSVDPVTYYRIVHPTSGKTRVKPQS